MTIIEPEKFRLYHKFLKGSKIDEKDSIGDWLLYYHIRDTDKYYDTLIRHYSKLFCFSKSGFQDYENVIQHFKVGRTLLLFKFGPSKDKNFAILYNERLGFIFELNVDLVRLDVYVNMKKQFKNMVNEMVTDLKNYCHQDDYDMLYEDEESPYSYTRLYNMSTSRVVFEFENITKIIDNDLTPLNYF